MPNQILNNPNIILDFIHILSSVKFSCLLYFFTDLYNGLCKSYFNSSIFRLTKSFAELVDS